MVRVKGCDHICDGLFCLAVEVPAVFYIVLCAVFKRHEEDTAGFKETRELLYNTFQFTGIKVQK